MSTLTELFGAGGKIINPNVPAGEYTWFSANLAGMIASISGLSISGDEFVTCAELTGSFLVQNIKLLAISNEITSMQVVIDGDASVFTGTNKGASLSFVGNTADATITMPPLYVKSSLVIKAKQPNGVATGAILEIAGRKIVGE